MGGFSHGKKYGKGVLEHFAKRIRIEGSWVADKTFNPLVIEV